jgi:uncharacterized OsmC-like protein
MQAKAELINGFKSKINNGRGHEVIADLPESLKGTDQGATALELTVMSLAGCISTIFAMVAGNSGVQFANLEVEVTADKPKDQKTIVSASAKVKIKSDAPQAKLERILEKTMGICPVGLIFEKAGINIETELIAEGL